MGSEFFRLQSIDLENSVVRYPRVRNENRSTTRTIEVGATGSGATGVYTGERDKNQDYLIEGSISGNVIRGQGTFIYRDPQNRITNVHDLTGLLSGEKIEYGDIIRADGDTRFYGMTGMVGDTIYLTEMNTTVTGSVSDFQIRKNKISSTHFQYLKSEEGENKFYFDTQSNSWGYSGVEPVEDVLTKTGVEFYVPNDPITFRFLPSNATLAPDITGLDTTTTDPRQAYSPKVLVSKLPADTQEISLSPIPYPDDDENFKVYWGPEGKAVEKTKNIHYAINYTSDPDYTSAKPPYAERRVAYLRPLGELDNTLQVDDIGLGFEGKFNVHKAPITEATTEAQAVTDIFPNSLGLTIPGSETQYNGEVIRVGNEVFKRYEYYNIEYDNGIVTFIKHPNFEPVVRSVIKQKTLIWDGISVIKGVGRDDLVSQDSGDWVLPYPIAGLTGIDKEVYFEDTDANNFIKDTDYQIDYGSGAIKVNQLLKSNECVLVSYFVEGEDVETERVDLSTLKLRKFPVIESSVSITKKYSNATESSTGFKVLLEGVDFKVSYLTGKITILNPNVYENIEYLEATYTPFSQQQCILQPLSEDSDSYRITIIDDPLVTVDPLNLVFKVQNPKVSVKVEDPFGENDPTYSGSIIPYSIVSLRAEGEPGYGLGNLTEAQMYDIGVTGLQRMGLDQKLGMTPEQFYAMSITEIVELGITDNRSQDYNLGGYAYDEVNKTVYLDVKNNIDRAKPDLNDLVMATYSYESDVLPYAPIQILFPIFNEDETSFEIEGFDKTSELYPGMIIRIDNFDPENRYYYKIQGVSYDGYNTTVSLYGYFPEDIRNPQFYVFDDLIPWVSLPSGTTIDPAIVAGSDTLILEGKTLETLNLLKPQALFLVDETDVYEILSTAINGDEIQVKIFPKLRRSSPESIQISPVVYTEDDTLVTPTYPILDEPAHPAFKIYYRKPASALFGQAFIYIDPEAIRISELVDGYTAEYQFKMTDYGSLRDLAVAIVSTKSTASPEHYDYYPFSLNDDVGVEQYYVTGYWGSNLVLPMEGSSYVDIPTEGYLVTIKQELFKYKLISTLKDEPHFHVPEKDRTDIFHSGDLLAFRSKNTGAVYFYEVEGSEVEEEGEIQNTKVTLKDHFTESMLDPSIYRYTDVGWNELQGYTVDKAASTITFSSNNEFFKASAVIRINERYIYQVDLVSGVILHLSPAIRSAIPSIDKVEISDMPIYLDGVTTQAYFPIQYYPPEGHSGTATVTIDDDKITIRETVDGMSPIEKFISFERYPNLYELAGALERLDLSVPGDGGLRVDVETYKTYFESYGSQFRLVPIQASLPYSIPVSRPAINVVYTSPDGLTDSEIIVGSDGIRLIEWSRSDRSGTERVNVITTANKPLYQISSEIAAVVSIVGSSTPWGITNLIEGNYFCNVLNDYYSVTPFSGSDAKKFPYIVNVTESPKYWTALGVINRNVLEEGKDYELEGTELTITAGIKHKERYELSYLGLWNLAEYEDQDVTCSCRYFDVLPKGYEIQVYVDFYRPDQFYIQKLTERKFLEIVTLPQVQELLQQLGGSVGQGSDDGSDNPPQVYQGGSVDLKYLLQDEKIKKEIYLKLFRWYKHRLRNFASEIECTLGFKLGNCNFIGVNDGRFTLEDKYVEDDNYTLTKDDDLQQIKNGFSRFFPVGYQSPAPMQHPRFTEEAMLSNEVFCYNIVYKEPNSNGQLVVTKTEGRVVATDAYWADVKRSSDSSFSRLDFDLLPNDTKTNLVTSSSGDPLYEVSYNEEEKNFRSSVRDFKFLKRISEGDSIRLEGKEPYYEIKSISRIDETTDDTIVKIPRNPADSDGNAFWVYPNSSDPVWGKQISETYEFNSDGVPVDKVTKKPAFKTVKPATAYERLVLKDGQFFKDKEIRSFVVTKNSSGQWIYTFYKKNRSGTRTKYEWTLEQLEREQPKSGMNIYLKRATGGDYPVTFPAWDDGYSLGSMAQATKLIDHKRGTDRIKKAFNWSEFLDLLDDEAELFCVEVGTFNEYTGEFVVKNTVNINMDYLTLKEERKVSEVLEAIRYGLTGYEFPLPFPPFILKVSNTYKKNEQRGCDKYFYVDFDKYYDKDVAVHGYEEGLIFRSRDRNTWFRFKLGSEESNYVTDEYGFNPTLHTNFYNPNNLFLKLILEKQYWLTELSVLKDLLDTNNKLKRAYKLQSTPQNVTVGAKPIKSKDGITNDTDSGFSEFRDYLLQVCSGLGQRLTAYTEHLRFLLDRSDTTHTYLVDNTSGPLYRTQMENVASTAIERSYQESVTAENTYSIFQSERDYYLDYNGLNYLRWNSDWTKWSLSLEQGRMYQKLVRDQITRDGYVNIGFTGVPGIKLRVPGAPNGTPVVTGAKYRIYYNIIAQSATDSDDYEDSVLQISYSRTGYTVGVIKEFQLSSYPTLKDLIDAVNTQCITEDGFQAITASLEFDYPPYGAYSTRWLVRNYRAVSYNSSNGPDTNLPTDGWVLLSELAGSDDRIYVANVADHREYDPRVFFLYRCRSNRNEKEYTETFNLNNDRVSDTVWTGFRNQSLEAVNVFPVYIPSVGKEIFSTTKLGELPVSGRWAEDAMNQTGDSLDYTTQFDVLSIRPSLQGNSIIDYRFLDYSRTENQVPGKEQPRNDLNELSETQLQVDYGYDSTKKIIRTPRSVSYGEFDLLNNKKKLEDRSEALKNVEPQTEVIRGLQISLNVTPVADNEKNRLVIFEFDLRTCNTIALLKQALTENRYKILETSENGITRYTAQLTYDAINKIQIEAGGARYFKSDYIGDSAVKESFRTTDLVTRYVPQIIHAETHEFYQKYGNDPLTDVPEVSEEVSVEPVNRPYTVGWILREENFYSGQDIRLRIDPRTYSPGPNFRFIVDNPSVARNNIFMTRDGEDILAFDLYCMDDDGAYQIYNNVLYLRSRNLPEYAIPLSKSGTPTVDDLHPEERMTLADLIHRINTNTSITRYFYADMRFGRKYGTDYEYTYFPNTSTWYGDNDGWVPISKANTDSLYLDKDYVFRLSTTNSNAKYQIVPTLSPFPVDPDPDVIYTSSILRVQADARFFTITPNLSDYSVTSTTYNLDSGAADLTLVFNYQTTTGQSDDIDMSGLTVQDVVDAINATAGISATVAPGVGGYSAEDLYQPINNTVPGTIYWDDGVSDIAAIYLVYTGPEYINGSFAISGVTLTLSYYLVVDNTLSTSLDLNVYTDLQSLKTAIEAIVPIAESAFSVELIWIDSSQSTGTMVTAVGDFPLTGDAVSFYGNGVHDYHLLVGGASRTIEDLVGEINALTGNTGFYVDGLESSEYAGYKTFLANLLVPVTTLTNLGTTEWIEADFRATKAFTILNMSGNTVKKYDSATESYYLEGGEPCRCSVSGNSILFEKSTRSLLSSNYFSSRFQYSRLDRKDVTSFMNDVMNLNGSLQNPGRYYSYLFGSLKADIAFIPVESITYGKLRLRDRDAEEGHAGTITSMDLLFNDPEELNSHVYFGVMGDMRFLQISDYNLNKQYVAVKRRLGQPWDSAADPYVSNSKYDFSKNFLYSIHQNSEFMAWLKYTRFGELINSINSEGLINMKYLWLYLKFHKEIGCDQRAIYLQKKIEQDDKTADLIA